jgi:FdhD protein
MKKIDGAIPRGPEGTLLFPILRLTGGGESGPMEDIVLEERRLRLFVDGREEAAAVLSSGMEREWAVGYLHSLRRIKTIRDVASAELLPDRIRVVLGRSFPGLPTRNGPLHSGAGAFLEEIGAGPFGEETFGANFTITARALLEGIDWIGEEPTYRATGAAHVVALIRPDGTRLVRVPDVGRHNAADKAIGWAVERGIDLPGVCAVTSGRLPEDMVAKFAGSRIPLVASVSAATAAGIRLASTLGMTLIGFCRENRMNLYCGAGRILGTEGNLPPDP